MIGRALSGVVNAPGVRRVILWLWAASIGLVTVLSVIPDAAPPGPPGTDKLWHALAYLALGIGAGAGPVSRLRLPAAAATIALGWALEGVQAQLPWRSAELADGLVNTLAALVGTALALLVVRYAERADPR